MEPLLSHGFLAPPTVFITLCLLGAVVAIVWRRAGIALVLLSALCLFAAATPALSSWLLRQVETGLPSGIDIRGAQAIVVLGGDIEPGNGADIPDRLGPLSLQRVVWAAEAYRLLHLPVAVSGGATRGVGASAAALMKAALERDFAVPVAWVEDRSHTTWQNAVDTARLLQLRHVNGIVLVTHAWHLRRALWSFARVGFAALPWPAPRTALRLGSADDFLPSVGGLRDSFHALHEAIGMAYYRLRH